MRDQPKKGAGLAYLLFLGLMFVAPQNQLRGTTTDSLKINLDYGAFKYLPDTEKSYLEIYYSLEQKELDYIKQVEGYGTVISMEITLTNQAGEKVKEKTWQVGSLVTDPGKAQNSDIQMIDILGDTLKPGTYFLEFKVTDLNSSKVGVKKAQILIPDFKGGALQMSDLQLVLNLSPEDTSDVKFNKSGMRVLPNPRGEYISKTGMLYFYAEIYNLKTDLEGEKKGYSLSFSILDSNGSNPKDYGYQINTKPGNSAVVMSALNISSLSPGKYSLQLLAKDLDSGDEVINTKPFQVVPVSAFQVSGEEPLTEEEAKDLRKMLIYIGSRDELKMYDQLNLSGKKQFMTEFWKKRDPDPSTPENEFKIGYCSRWEEANLRYSSKQRTEKDGWRTDMGRVYIIYGEPDDIERHPYSMASLSWERWNYDHIQGGVYFVFVDKQGYGIYKLVHSTAKGEIKDPDWLQRIDTEGGTQTSEY
jgi:GWxTD domain-containing protein